MKFKIEFNDEQVTYFEFLKSCETKYDDAAFKEEDTQAMQFYFNRITDTRTEYCKVFGASMIDLLTDLDLYFMCKYYTENKTEVKHS